ncbi:Legumin B [Morus notabilis]|uniref:Legumin B n=1 Tax=Morus notabilis TaxID=981085 RepID=W9SE14_9ROSA|nr:Legumin B [Morus notabilis]
MANSSLLGLALYLLLFNVCCAQIEQMPMQFGRQHRLQGLRQRWKTECRFERVQGLQPSRRVESEAGISEYWDVRGDREDEDSFSKGIHGAVIPGCPETYESGQSQRSQEQHQKVRAIREGDIVAAPAGVAQWIYNNGDSPLVIVTFIDVANPANQLDLFARRFHLGGNPQKEQQTEQQMLRQSRSQRSESAAERRNPNGNKDCPSEGRGSDLEPR